MILPLQNFGTLLENMASGLQGSAAQIIDLSVGSVLRALLEACASIALWMQWLILQVLSMTRAATSVGSDLDSWMADFSMVRLPGASSNGIVSFARYSTGLAATIPVGSVVRTIDGSQSFAVIEDISNSAWTGPSGYALAADIASVALPVQAISPGAAGNVIAGSIGLLGSAIPGVDYVLNVSGFYGGVDAESDAALRARFQLYVNSRSLATAGAVGAAIQSLQQGLRYCVLENVDAGGNVVPGNFRVIIDDGTGVASNVLIAEVSAAVDSVRPIGSTYSVSGPLSMAAIVQMSITTVNSSTSMTIAGQVQQAVAAWIAGLPMGGTLAISKLDSIAHGASSSVLSVTTSINGVSADLQVPTGVVIGLGLVNVTAT